MSKLHVAIVGATGAVGESFLDLLSQRQFPLKKLSLVASSRSAGRVFRFGKDDCVVHDIEQFDFSGVDVAFFSAGSAASKQYAPKALAAGCHVIDNPSCFRMDPNVPLIIPEVNPECLPTPEQPRLIANPNCSTIQMLVALYPLHRDFGLKKLFVSTYQAVSGTGKSAILELAEQSQGVLEGRDVSPSIYPRQIAFNLLPQIDVFSESGYCKEELKMVNETHKILQTDSITVLPTTVRVPVSCGHSEAITIETNKVISRDAALLSLKKAHGITVCEQHNEYPTPFEHGLGTDDVYVGRIRQLENDPYHLSLWCVADNIRKGAALNSIQIAEHFLL